MYIICIYIIYIFALYIYKHLNFSCGYNFAAVQFLKS